jgi:hypothetical protein
MFDRFGNRLPIRLYDDVDESAQQYNWDYSDFELSETEEEEEEEEEEVVQDEIEDGEGEIVLGEGVDEASEEAREETDEKGETEERGEKEEKEENKEVG